MTLPEVRRHRKAVPEKAVPQSDRFLIGEAVAAQYLSCSQVTFRKWVAAGVIDRVELPGGLRRNLFLRTDVEALAKRLAGRS